MAKQTISIVSPKRSEELLERVVNLSIDAIVAADRKGNVLIFNESAERVFGYKAEEVIGRLNIEKIYPAGIAREVMRMMRSPMWGGTGRVQGVQLEVLSKEGKNVPISLYGAIVYEEGQEVATIGYFMDMREKLRLQKQMEEIDQKLAEREKEAALAELAGALAHELNQPLTTINSWIYLLNKKIENDNPMKADFKILQEEVDKMAQIVRRIGLVTRYETRSYAGRAQIIDIEGAGREKKDNPEDKKGKPR
ncbi:MAG: PAS domain S-box protein [Proteobacteria bacterium]|jgi:PAS domain S-box-containing protein|nr:PAS domain S-box protein [Pseudomonadota bacterium]